MNVLTQILTALSKPFQWWVVIAVWEQGLRVRLGKRTTLLNAGIHLKIPFFDRVFVVATRLRAIHSNGHTAMSADGKPVTYNVALEFEVVDARRLFENVSNPEMTLLMRVCAALASRISATVSTALEYRDLESCSAGAIECDGWGLGNVSVRITDFAIVRTIKLMQNEYRSYSGLDDALRDGENNIHR